MNTVRLAHELSGPPNAPVLVLGSVLGTTRDMWAPQLRALTERFRVLRYDHRGHGDSPVPDGPYTLADLGSDVLVLCDELGIGNFGYCGLSFGGMVGMWLGAAEPSRVDGLALLCTSAHLGPEAGYTQRATTVRTEGIGSIAEAVVGRWFTPDMVQRDPSTVQAMKEMLLRTPPEGYAGCCEAIGALDQRDELAKVTAPTLVIGSADDPAIPPEHSAQIADKIEGSRLEVLTGAAHLVSLERADEVNRLLVDHFARVWQ